MRHEACAPRRALLTAHAHAAQGRLVVVLCNLKARNMRGVKSFGMLLAASDEAHENVELVRPGQCAALSPRAVAHAARVAQLSPPAEAKVGERVRFGDAPQTGPDSENKCGGAARGAAPRALTLAAACPAAGCRRRRFGRRCSRTCAPPRPARRRGRRLRCSPQRGPSPSSASSTAASRERYARCEMQRCRMSRVALVRNSLGTLCRLYRRARRARSRQLSDGNLSTLPAA